MCKFAKRNKNVRGTIGGEVGGAGVMKILLFDLLRLLLLLLRLERIRT